MKESKRDEQSLSKPKQSGQPTRAERKPAVFRPTITMLDGKSYQLKDRKR